MSKTQKMLLLIMIIIVMIIIIILGIFIIGRRNGAIYSEPEPDETSQEIPPEEILSVEAVRNRYYVVEGVINKYYTYLDIISNIEKYYEGYSAEELKTARDENKQIVYNMLDREVINANNITVSNLEEITGKVTSPSIDITSMYVTQRSANMHLYIVKGTIREENNLEPFTIVVKIDYANETFSIIPNGYVEEKLANAKLGDNLDIEVSENIEVNRNNKYVFKTVADEAYAVDMFNKLKEELMYNKEAIYNDLDEEYSKAKFGTLEKFESYVENKYKNIANVAAAGMQKTNREEYTQYTITDTEGNYYIFYETAPMEYTLILDTYTIDIPEFITRYNESNAQERVILNINKIMLAINDGDYNYVYSKLADSFKTTNFANYEAFENYMKTNFFEKNSFEYMEFGDEAGTYYTYRVSIRDASENSDNTINKTFIMLLGEGTDFEFSFNLN